MTRTDVQLPSLLTIDQLAEHLGTSRRHIRRLIADHRVPYLKVGRLVRFDPAEIATWLDETRHGTGDGYGRRKGSFGSEGGGASAFGRGAAVSVGV